MTRPTIGLVRTSRPSILMRVANVFIAVTAGGKVLGDPESAEIDRVQQQARGHAVPRGRVLRRCTFTRTAISGFDIMKIEPKRPTSTSEAVPVLVYLHGGAYVNPATVHHWDLMAALALSLGVSVVAPLYPLAPEGTAGQVVPRLVELHERLAAQAGAAPVWAGDSAGGGLALATALAVRDVGGTLPAHLVLFGPWLDVELNNPDIAAFVDRDPMLDRPGLRYDASLWRDHLPADHPWVSPLNGSFQGLSPTTVIVGTRDMFTPDCRAFAEKAAQAGVDAVLYEYADGFHVFPAATFLPESKNALDAVARRLVLNSQQPGPRPSTGDLSRSGRPDTATESTTETSSVQCRDASMRHAEQRNGF